MRVENNIKGNFTQLFLSENSFKVCEVLYN